MTGTVHRIVEKIPGPDCKMYAVIELVDGRWVGARQANDISPATGERMWDCVTSFTRTQFEAAVYLSEVMIPEHGEVYPGIEWIPE